MPVFIDKVNFFSEFQGVSDEPVDWLLANIGDKIRIELEFTVKTAIIPSTDNPITYHKTDGYITPVGEEWIYDQAGRFADFKVGDLVLIANYDVFSSHGTFTILEKDADLAIRVGGVTGFGANSDQATVAISIVTPIKAARYKYNFIENDDAVTFQSKISGTEQLLVNKDINANSPTLLDMEFIGEKSYQIGSAQIQGIELDDGTTDAVYKSVFKIVHITEITPFLLSAQIDDLLAGTAPDYYFNTKCLKGIFDIEAMYDYTDPNRIQTIEVTEVKGNTGWFDENFNTGLTNYSKDSISFKDATGNTIVAVQLSTSKTSVTAIIKNTEDTPFSDNNTKFVLNFAKIPFDQSEYQLNGRTIKENFTFDRALQTVGSVAVNGDNYGTDLQVLKNIVGTFNSTSEITVTFDIVMDANVIDILNESETPRYLIWLSTQNYLDVMVSADKVSLTLDKQEFYSNTSDPTMIVLASKVLRHPESDVNTQGVSSNDIQTAATDPGNIFWSFVVSVSPSGALIKDTTNGRTIGVADFTTDWPTTMDLLVASINANVPAGSLFGGAPAFDNSVGFTASWNPFGDGKVHVNCPPGLGAEYNGVQLNFDVNGGTVTRNPSAVQAFAGGVDAIYKTIDVFPEDEMVGFSRAYINLSGRESDEIILKSVTTQVKVKNTSNGKEFVLDLFQLEMSSYEFIGPVQFFDFGTDRSFHIPEGTIRKQIAVSRRTDLDGGSKYYFDIQYPFLMRWEYWEKLLGANSDFFDSAAPNNGFNHFWHHFQSGNWKIYFETIVKATKNGAVQTYNSEQLLTSHDWDSNTDWTPVSIKTYDPDTMTELTQGGNKYVLGYKNTLVKAVFTKVSGAPVLANCTVNLGIEVFEQGGIKGRRRMSSKWPSDSDTWFLSLSNDAKTDISLAVQTITAQALIDFSKIPAATKFQLAARIYEINLAGLGKLTEDGDAKLTEDGTYKIIE